MSRTKSIILAVSTLILATLACNAVLPTVQPTLEQQQATPQSQPNDIPLTEAEVPRVPVKEARAAFDGGEAIIVDVRIADAYTASHIAGAISIQLSEIETNPAGLNLDKDQWIITYCT